MAILTVGPLSQYPNIAAALTAAGLGDTIQLESGYGGENATIALNNLTVDGDATSGGIVLTLAPGVTNFTLTGQVPITVLDAADGNTIVGNSGDNEITVSDGVDVVNGGGGTDRLIVNYALATGAVTGDSTTDFTEAGGAGRSVTITNGTFENFTVITGSGADTITTGAGDDIIAAGSGANTITAGQGFNNITGGSDADTITTLDGGSFIDGGDGANVITSGGGNDVILSGTGADTIEAGGGNDRITVRGGVDDVRAGAGNDRMIVDYSDLTTSVTGGTTAGNLGAGYTGGFNDGSTNSIVFDGVESFTVITGSGDDNITTGDGDDVLVGGAGDDILTGGGGDDVLTGGGGDDVLSGGAGSNDRAVFSGHRTDYTVASFVPGTVVVTDIRAGSPDGTDYVTDVEVLSFNAIPSGLVTISGALVAGQVLTASETLGDADGMGAVTYRWQRDDGAGGYVDIAGAMGSTYALARSDVGRTVLAVASYIDGLGKTEEVESAATAAVSTADNAPTGTVSLAGLAERGSVLTATDTLMDADGMGPVTYRWQRADGAGGYVDIAGATGPTYTLEREDIGLQVRAVASYTDGFGTAEEVAGSGTPAVAPRQVPVVTPVDTVSDTRTLTLAGVRALVADGDVFTLPANTDEVRLADGVLSFGSGSDASYVTRLYGGALGRTGDAAGLAGWTGEPGADVDRVAVARGFLDSPEYQARHGAQTDAQFVGTTYRELLFREAEADGLVFWEDRMAQGASRADVLAGIADSPEARSAWSGTTSAGVFVPDEQAGLVRATYQAAFGRDPEAAGLVFHADALDGGLTTTEFGDRVQASPEFGAIFGTRTDAEYVESLYANALGRAAGEEEVSYYEAVLASGTEDRSDVLLDFVYSPEGREHLNWVL